MATSRLLRLYLRSGAWNTREEHGCAMASFCFSTKEKKKTLTSSRDSSVPYVIRMLFFLIDVPTIVHQISPDVCRWLPLGS